MKRSRMILGLGMTWALAASAAHAQVEGREAAEAALAEFQKYYANENEHVRKAAVDGLAAANHEIVVDPLLKVLRDPAPEVREAAAQGLSKITTREGVLKLRKTMAGSRKEDEQIAILRAFQQSKPELAYDSVLELCESKRPDVRATALETIAVLPKKEESSEELTEILGKCLEDKDPVIRLSALDATGRLDLEALAPTCLECLEDSDWRVRVSALEAVTSLRVDGSVPPLIAMLKREEGRLQDDCFAALRELTGEINFTSDPAEWEAWWERVGSSWKVPTKAEIQKVRDLEAKSRYQYSVPETSETFLEIATRSRKMIFLIDVSASMSDKLVFDVSDPKRRAQLEERYSKYRTKIELAREEMIRTIAGLESYVSFNIVTFHTDIEKWEDGLVPANSGNKNKAIKFLSRFSPEGIDTLAKSTETSGRTNTFDALNAAFGMESDSRRPATRSSRKQKTESDTVFLVTDGLPTAGRITEPGELLRYVMTVNKRTKLVFHTIGFSHSNELLLEGISKTSGGEHLVIGQ